MNKLDYLAQKEEELRKLNEQLDSKQGNLLKKVQNMGENAPTESDLNRKDIFANNAWTVNPPKEEEPEEDDYEEDKMPEEEEAEEAG